MCSLRCDQRIADLPFAGSFGRTAEDLVLLDSILRSSNATTTAVGAIPEPVSCAVNVDRNMSLAGLRIGLPSNFGWVTPGISSEVGSQLLQRRGQA